MTLKNVTLDDKYTLSQSRVFVTGYQALVRACLTFSIVVSSCSPKKIRLGRPQSGSCMARCRSLVSVAAMVSAVRRI